MIEVTEEYIDGLKRKLDAAINNCNTLADQVEEGLNEQIRLNKLIKEAYNEGYNKGQYDVDSYEREDSMTLDQFLKHNNL